MSKYDKLVTNAAGRIVPTVINGRTAIPYMGIGKYKPDGRRAAPKLASCADFPPDGNKVTPGLKEALVKAGIRDGMTISTHHHFRNGNLVGTQAALKRAYQETESTVDGFIPDSPELGPPLPIVTGVGEVVKVDIFLPGCPPRPEDFFYVFSEVLAGRIPVVLPPQHFRYD